MTVPVVVEKEYTVETVRAALVQTALLREKLREQADGLRELDQTLVVRVGTEVNVPYERYSTLVNVSRRCERCGSRLGALNDEKVVEFDGKYWHKHNCGK